MRSKHAVDLHEKDGCLILPDKSSCFAEFSSCSCGVRADHRVAGVEAEPGEIAIVEVGGATVNNLDDGVCSLPANARANTLYSMAAEIIREHGYDRGAAINAARVCMARAGTLSSVANAGGEDRVDIPQAPLVDELV